MRVIDHIPVELDEEMLLRALKVNTLNDQKKEMARSLIKESRELLAPKAVYTDIKIDDNSGQSLRLENNETLKSSIIASLLKSGQTVTLYVVTIGSNLEEQVSQFESAGLLLKAYLLDKIGNYALRSVKNNVKLIVEDEMDSRVSSFSPGEGIGKLFGIEQQKVLFKILQPYKNVGVQLTSNYFMIPRKSVSGVFAATVEEYVACQYCPKKCEYRRVAYTGPFPWKFK